jgi:hypothetical protein
MTAFLGSLSDFVRERISWNESTLITRSCSPVKNNEQMDFLRPIPARHVVCQIWGERCAAYSGKTVIDSGLKICKSGSWSWYSYFVCAAGIVRLTEKGIFVIRAEIFDHFVDEYGAAITRGWVDSFLSRYGNVLCERTSMLQENSRLEIPRVFLMKLVDDWEIVSNREG